MHGPGRFSERVGHTPADDGPEAAEDRVGEIAGEEFLEEADVAAEDAPLLDRLVRIRTPEPRGAVGSEQDERRLSLRRLNDGGHQVRDSRPRGRDDRGRPACGLPDAESEKAGRALVDLRRGPEA